jgi:hypothetical protein
VPDVELFRTALNAGIGTFLALVVIYWYRQDAKDRISELQEQYRREREDKLLLIQVVQDNTRAMAELKAIIERLQEAR